MVALVDPSVFVSVEEVKRERDTDETVRKQPRKEHQDEAGKLDRKSANHGDHCQCSAQLILILIIVPKQNFQI